MPPTIRVDNKGVNRGVNKGVDNADKAIENKGEMADLVRPVLEGSGSVVGGDGVDLAPGGHKFTKNYKGDKKYVPGRDFYGGMDLVTNLDKLEKIKLKSHIDNCKRKIERSMVSMFRSLEAMDMFVEPGSLKVRYTFECPIEGGDFRGNSLSTHLSGMRHGRLSRCQIGYF